MNCRFIYRLSNVCKMCCLKLTLSYIPQQLINFRLFLLLPAESLNFDFTYSPLDFGYWNEIIIGTLISHDHATKPGSGQSHYGKHGLYFLTLMPITLKKHNNISNNNISAWFQARECEGGCLKNIVCLFAFENITLSEIAHNPFNL